MSRRNATPVEIPPDIATIRANDSTENQASDNADAWPTLCPVPKLEAQAPEIDVGIFPDELATWMQATTGPAGISADWMVPGVNVGLGATIGNAWRIQPKEDDPRWIVTPNTYGAIAIPPGMLKSFALDEAVQPVRRLQQLLLTAFENERQDKELDAHVALARVDFLKKKLDELARADDLDQQEIAATKAKLIDAQDEAENARLRVPHIISGDTTTERMLRKHLDNPRGQFVMRDELFGWYMDLHKRGRESDRALYLEGHDGGRPYTQDRQTRDDTHIPMLTLSVLGGIQPDRLRELQDGAMNGGSRDGLLQRFQALVWPDELPEWQRRKGRLDLDLLDRVSKIYERIYRQSPADLQSTGVVRFQPAAQTLFWDWFENLERRIRRPEIQATPAFAGWVGKERSFMPSIALMFHLVDLVTGRTIDTDVGLDATKRAIALVDYFRGHARKVYAPELRQREAAAQNLADRILDGHVSDEDRVRDLYAKGWSGLDRAGMTTALDVLERLGWLRVESQATGGRPTKVIRLRPDLFHQLERIDT